MPTKTLSKIYETHISRFDGGISDDVRQKSSNSFALSKHFNIFSSPNKLIPYRSTEADTHDGATSDGMKQYNIQNFQLGLDGKLYGLGRVAATSCPKVVSKANPISGNWTLESTAQGTGALIRGCFIEWQSAWWMFSGTTNVSKWTIGSTFTDTVGTVGTITTVAQGIIGADNNLYLFYNNKVVRVTPAGAVEDDVCSAIPSDMRITSVARYGTYLAIGCAYGTSATATPSGRSQVYIWDMVTDETVSDVVDWGEGALMVLGNIEGRLVGVSDKYMSSTLGLLGGSMVVRMWGGGIPQVFKEIVSNQTVTIGRFIRDVVVKDNRMYWVASVPFGSSTSTESTFNLGIWAFGRKNRDSEFVLTLDFIEEGIDTANFKINSFGNAGNYFFINHSADGSITKTDDTANYTFTSVYESQKFGDGKQNKKLIGVNVTTEFLPAAGQVKLKYKKNEETSWTQIFVHTTDNSLSHSAINIESYSTAVTMTIATPAVVTLASHGLVAGQIIRFNTTGALPTGVTAGANYYVLSTSLATDTFRFSATLEGTAVNTTGSQSGVHTIDRTTTLPTYKEIQLRIESVGNAEVTGLRFQYEELSDDIF